MRTMTMTMSVTSSSSSASSPGTSLLLGLFFFLFFHHVVFSSLFFWSSWASEIKVSCVLNKSIFSKLWINSKLQELVKHRLELKHLFNQRSCIWSCLFFRLLLSLTFLVSSSLTLFSRPILGSECLMDLNSLGNLDLEEGVVRMNSVLFAFRAEIEVGTLCAFVSDANNWRGFAGVAGYSFMDSLVDWNFLSTSLVLLSVFLCFLEGFFDGFERTAMTLSKLLEELLNYLLGVSSSDCFSNSVHNVNWSDIFLVIDHIFDFSEKVSKFEVIEDLIVLFLHLFSLGRWLFFGNYWIFFVKF